MSVILFNLNTDMMYKEAGIEKNRSKIGLRRDWNGRILVRAFEDVMRNRVSGT